MAKHSSTAEDTQTSSPFASWIGRVLAIALVLATIVGLATLVKFNWLPLWWVIGGGAAAAVIAALVAVFLWRTRVPPSWFRFVALSLVSVLGIAASALGVKVVGDVGDVFQKTAPKDPKSEYVVIVLADHDSSQDSLRGENIGELENDANRSAVEATLESKFEATFTPRADPTELAAGLTAQEYSAAVLDSSFLAVYEEADVDFYDSVKIIYTFDLDTPSAIAAPPPSAEPKEQGESFIMYISGIDTAGAINKTSRSDVNILMVVNPAAGKVLLVNTPRDYYVQLHDTTGTKDKLTHAGNFGVQKSIDTLQDLYGIHIDYYARVNFSSLVKIVDTVGGVDVNVDETFTSRHGNRTFQAGLNHLDGEEALSFSRERYAFAAGDRTRGQNQQKVIAALIDKASQRSNLLRYDKLLNSVEDAVETNVPMDQIGNVVRQRLEDGKSWQTESISVDGTGASLPTYSMGSRKLYVMIPDESTLEAARQRIEATLSE